jgi:hypothetical protein
LLKEAASKERIPNENEKMVTNRDQYGNITSFGRSQLLPEITIFAQIKYLQIRPLKEHDECLNTFIELIRKKKSPKLEANHQFTEVFSANFVFTFLYNYLDRKEDFEFEEQLFDELYYRLVDFYFMPSKMAKASVPILNLKADCKVEKIDLEDGLIIRRVSENDFNKLFLMAEQNFTRTISTIELSSINFIIEKLYDNKTDINWLEVKKTFDMVTLAFRLVKSGNLGFNSIILETKGWPDEWQNWSIGPAHNLRPEAPVVAINQEDINEIVRLWPLIKNHWNEFSIAMRRFNYANERENEEDKLLDNVIALESLFKITGYGVAARTAQFIGNEKNEKYEILGKVREAYDLRSKLAHGSNSQTEQKLKETNKSIREYLAKAIKKFIETKETTKQSQDDIIESEEKKMFSD